MKIGIAACLSASFLFFSHSAMAAEITVMAGDLPPMINQDGTGREAEIISTVLGHCGHTTTFVVQPFTRHWQSFENGSGDAVATVPVGMPTAGTQTQAGPQGHDQHPAPKKKSASKRLPANIIHFVHT